MLRGPSQRASSSGAAASMRRPISASSARGRRRSGPRRDAKEGATPERPRCVHRAAPASSRGKSPSSVLHHPQLPDGTPRAAIARSRTAIRWARAGARDRSPRSGNTQSSIARPPRQQPIRLRAESQHLLIAARNAQSLPCSAWCLHPTAPGISAPRARWPRPVLAGFVGENHPRHRGHPVCT